jgi:probable rRNA maturation factor
MTAKRHQRGDRRTGRDRMVMENCQRKVRLNMAPLERFLTHMHVALGLKRDSTFVRFVTDSEMARLNGTFRKKPKTTDVLSFPSDERGRPPRLHARTKSLRGQFLGDIAISPVVAGQNAKRYGRSLEAEICILMLHGLLHLLGYDHETDRGEMERVEAKLQRQLRIG